MRGALIVLLLAVAAPALAAGRGGTAAGDVATYNASLPPQVVIEEIYAKDIDTKTFILVEGALLVPDAIIVNIERRVVRIEVVDEDEIDRLEPVAQIRLPDVLDLGKLEKPGEDIVRFEQKIWRDGLRLVLREYAHPGGVRVQYTAFRVTFETSGHLYRAAVTFYQARSTVEQHLDAVRKDLGNILDEIGKIGENAEKVRKTLTTAVDELDRRLDALDRQMQAIQKAVEKVSDVVSSIEQRVRSLERDN